MVRLACLIKIYDGDADPLQITFVNTIKIESSWREFTDKATVILPRFIDIETGINSDKEFRNRMLEWSKNHPVIEIFLGYETPSHLAFKGIIRDVKGRVPVELVCEDHMYFLKSGLISVAYPKKEGDELKGIKVSEFIKEYFKVAQKATDIEYEAENIKDFDLGAFKLENKTPVKFLEMLRDDYGVYSFIRYKKKGDVYLPYLHVGTEYPERVPKKGFFRFYDNIIDDDLIYREYEDINIQVRYVLQGKKEEDVLTVVVPSNDKVSEKSQDVEELEFKYFDPTYKSNNDEFSADELDNSDIKKKLLDLAVNKLYQLKYTGFRGSFTTFGDTLYITSDQNKVGDFIRHGDVILLREQSKQGTIVDFKREDQLYFVDAVNYSYGLEGFRQEIHLGISAEEGTRPNLSKVSSTFIGQSNGTSIKVNIVNEVSVSQSISVPGN
ncbi:hypothetical protein M0D21_01565 [Aquimarina sp. D1M17]|uniref:hypothetical protein n=1 Tax=Aquimarina acroporae TaxID=2937283 RepID=UPI0020BFC920|nr:hypothetical protein [Aquimarina acroporae]MCK8520232.1 hypothetical protein [Aquimarina acroporae]